MYVLIHRCKVGEAKRRKAKDKDYGKYINLDDQSVRERHLDSVMTDLFTTFTTEIRTLMLAESPPDNFQSICSRMETWVKSRLAKYREGDRDDIIVCLVVIFYELHTKYTVGDMHSDEQRNVGRCMFDCIYQVTKNCFSEKTRQEFKEMFLARVDEAPNPEIARKLIEVF